MILTRQLGDAQQAQAAVATAGTATTAILPLLTTAAWAVPVVGAAVAGVTIAIGALLNRKSGRQKTAATEVIQELEPYLIQNTQAFLAGPRTAASKEQALKNFDDLWNALISARGCGNPDLGDAGRRCIAERAEGGIYSWWKDHRDIIAATPALDPAAAAISSILPGVNVDSAALWIGAGLIFAALVIGYGHRIQTHA